MHLPDQGLIIKANDLLLEMIRSLKFQRLRQLVPSLPSQEPSAVQVEDDEEACTEGEDDEGEDDEDDDDDDDDDDFIARSEDEAI